MVNHPNRKQIATPEGCPAVGSFVSVPFGARATQIGHVVGYAKDGSIKVRAWNGTQGHWMPHPRVVPFGAWIKPASGAHLPTPPAI